MRLEQESKISQKLAENEEFKKKGEAEKALRLFLPFLFWL